MQSAVPRAETAKMTIERPFAAWLISMGIKFAWSLIEEKVKSKFLRLYESISALLLVIFESGKF